MNLFNQTYICFFVFLPLILLAASLDTQEAATVEVRQIDGRYQLFKDDAPFYIHGAGLEFGDIEALAAHGANSFRTWRTDNGRDTGIEVLDQAYANGLMVTMGIEIARERSGTGRGVFNFDYSDSIAVADQLSRVREEVLMYKDHPALLMWGIGNELNLESSNPLVWNAVNDISKMIHEVDGKHPTLTMLAGINSELIQEIKTRAPDLDLLGIQMYADIVNLPRYLKESGWDGPYVVTEWGATGHWEVATTSWGAPIENNSTVKADWYERRYQIAIASDTVQCVGSYVFLWGHKQERTSTWYGMFMPDGEKTAAVDVMEHKWTGAWPSNLAPRIDSFMLNEMEAHANIQLSPGMSVTSTVVASDADGDSLSYHWSVRREAIEVGHGGDDEDEPPLIPDLFVSMNHDQVNLNAPSEPGAYRLFVEITDGQGSAAHANIPFLVTDE
ncbi:MAG: hypothetical protein OXE92_09825 [Bacteroidetes bacterium]|nr:hypothetical protein [Bacteroidota bacterium]MCY4206006.1 hypothetical protein [Bacteroidota bacterium]